MCCFDVTCGVYSQCVMTVLMRWHWYFSNSLFPKVSLQPAKFLLCLTDHPKKILCHAITDCVEVLMCITRTWTTAFLLWCSKESHRSVTRFFYFKILPHRPKSMQQEVWAKSHRGFRGQHSHVDVSVSAPKKHSMPSRLIFLIRENSNSTFHHFPLRSSVVNEVAPFWRRPNKWEKDPLSLGLFQSFRSANFHHRLVNPPSFKHFIAKARPEQPPRSTLLHQRFNPPAVTKA